jgi:hypothetical protein
MLLPWLLSKKVCNKQGLPVELSLFVWVYGTERVTLIQIQACMYIPLHSAATTCAYTCHIRSIVLTTFVRALCSLMQSCDGIGYEQH